MDSQSNTELPNRAESNISLGSQHGEQLTTMIDTLNQQLNQQQHHHHQQEGRWQ